MEQGVHPTLIATGYRLAADRAHEMLKDIAFDVKRDDTKTLKKIAMTSMTGKGAGVAKELLADLAVDAVKTIAEKGVMKIDRDHVKLEKKMGGSTEDTRLIKGMVIDKERVHPGMPKSVKNARIALINSALEIEKREDRSGCKNRDYRTRTVKIIPGRRGENAQGHGGEGGSEWCQCALLPERDR